MRYVEYTKEIHDTLQSFGAGWWAAYSAYRRTLEWRTKAARVLQRAQRRCEVCKTQRATEVHHDTYERVGAELLEDLIAVCSTCHQELRSSGVPAPSPQK